MRELILKRINELIKKSKMEVTFSEDLNIISDKDLLYTLQIIITQHIIHSLNENKKESNE